MKKLKERIPSGFLTLATVFLVAIFVVENINHRFWLNDFKVYYSAAGALLNGTPVYGTLFALGSGYYKYSPFTLLLTLPFYAFPYQVACYVQYLLISVSIIATFAVSWHIINHYLLSERIKKANLFLSVAFICVINHLVRELHLGNINVILLLLLCLALLCILENKFVWAGILLALVIMTKPFFILMLLPLILRKNYRTVFAFGISMLFFLVCPVVLIGFSKNIELHKAWLRSLLDHNSAFPSNNTIENLVRLYIHSGLPASFQFYVMMAVCIGYLSFFAVNRLLERKEGSGENRPHTGFIVEWFLLIAMMPSLFKTDTQHFLLSLPVLMILLCHLSTAGNYLQVACFVLLMFMYGGNSSDLLGKVFSRQLDEAGILGISNLLLVSWTILVYFNFRTKEIHSR